MGGEKLQRAPSNPTPQVSLPGMETVRAGLLNWFAVNRRDLPWRRSRNPYHILVSEIMLQQTQVDRVLPHFTRFLNRFPSVEALASAPTADVIKAWAGLGYNRRAVNLQRTARFVVDDMGGAFPSDAAILCALPGIGPYTAGAIACFAFEQDVVFVDTNMRRVIHRLFVGVDLPRPTVSDRVLLDIAAEVLPAGRGWEWNQGLIEFGALHCTARRPACVVCPVQSACRAFPAIQSALALLPRASRPKPETPFAGSNRFYRGRVLAALRDLSDGDAVSGIDLQTLGPRVRDGFTDADVPWLRDVVDGLARDGLARAAEDSPPYDADHQPGTDASTLRVTLP